MDGAPNAPTASVTTSGDLPVAPVYAGAPVYSFAQAVRIRTREFLSEREYQRPDLSGEYASPFVPRTRGPRGGIEIQRNMAGIGIPFADPLDLFRMGRLEIDKKPTGVRRPSRPMDSSRMRHLGTSVYRNANKENIDYGKDM